MRRDKETIDKLVEASFGKNFKGTWFIPKQLFFGKIESLDYGYDIAKKIDIGPSNELVFWQYVGHFTKIDGSSLEIKRRYLKKAKKYKELYEGLFNQEVTISII